MFLFVPFAFLDLVREPEIICIIPTPFHSLLIPPAPVQRGTPRGIVFLHFLIRSLKGNRVSDSRDLFWDSCLCLLSTNSPELEGQMAYLVFLNVIVCSIFFAGLGPGARNNLYYSQPFINLTPNEFQKSSPGPL